MASFVCAVTPPSVPDDGDGLTYAFGALLSSIIRVLSPNIDPPVRALDGSTAWLVVDETVGEKTAEKASSYQHGDFMPST
jgi:hypothetical protein